MLFHLNVAGMNQIFTRLNEMCSATFTNTKFSTKDVRIYFIHLKTNCLFVKSHLQALCSIKARHNTSLPQKP